MSQLLNQQQLDSLMGDAVDFAAKMLANHPDFSYLLTQSKRIRELEAENANLKANVERLEKDVWRMKVFKGIDEDTKSTLKDALNTVPEWAKVLETIENNARLETENIELKAKVNQLTQVSEWQPIQTAPKNYTKILCLWPIKTAYRDSKGYWCRDEMEWWDKHEGELPDPILWKPLPEGWPNAAKEGNQS